MCISVKFRFRKKLYHLTITASFLCLIVTRSCLYQVLGRAFDVSKLCLSWVNLCAIFCKRSCVFAQEHDFLEISRKSRNLQKNTTAVVLIIWAVDKGSRILYDTRSCGVTLTTSKLCSWIRATCSTMLLEAHAESPRRCLANYVASPAQRCAPGGWSAPLFTICGTDTIEDEMLPEAAREREERVLFSRKPAAWRLNIAGLHSPLCLSLPCQFELLLRLRDKDHIEKWKRTAIG